MAVSGVDDVGLNLEVDGDEISRICIVGVDTAHFGSGKDDELGLLGGEEGLDVVLAGQIELGVGTKDQVGKSQGLELADNGRADQATVSRHEDLR